MPSAQITGPGLFAPIASPGAVQIGAQPADDPLILSVRAEGIGGDISTVEVSLGGLENGQYYDPVMNELKEASAFTPMRRVYAIDGADAYLVQEGSRYEYNEYRNAELHELVRGVAMATDRWQVEIPHAGNRSGEYSLLVIATSTTDQIGTSIIRLSVVNDSTSPEMSVVADYPTRGLVARVGDAVDIRAEVTDDLTGTYSVRLSREDTVEAFGEMATLELERKPNSDVWSFRNTVSPNVEAGVYSIGVTALDRAGNKTDRSVDIRIVEKIDTFQIDLKKGPNLISVPRELVSPSVDDIFRDVQATSVRTVVGGEWIETAEIRPGRGYLIDSTQDARLILALSEKDGSAMPLRIDSKEGWNLIGYASQTQEPMVPLTFYLGEELKRAWLIVVSESGDEARAKSTSPYVWATDGFPTTTGEPSFEDDSENLPVVELGNAYWIYLTEDGVLIP